MQSGHSVGGGGRVGTGSTKWHPLWHTRPRASLVALDAAHQRAYGRAASTAIVSERKCVIGAGSDVSDGIIAWRASSRASVTSTPPIGRAPRSQM